MVSNILSATTVGFEGQIIEVECDASKGLPTLQIVGLGNKAIDEAKERVRSAIKNSLLDFPSKRITINLAPANIPKDGAHFDLPIALAILCVGGQLLSGAFSEKVFAGELSLDGSLRPIKGALHIAETAKAAGAKQVFLPKQNVQAATFIKDIEIIGIDNLTDLFLHLNGEKLLHSAASGNQNKLVTPQRGSVTIDDIRGQDQAKRALAIAATGHHNILFTGPPGTGKTMLAKALVHLLPPLSHQEQIEVLKLQSLSSDNDSLAANRPFRSPHHTASLIALIGGGTRPVPGEMSLAHHGVLFLDELPEYPRASLEAMRQPLEDREISIARTSARVTFPANFMLVATKNPCPCGYLGDKSHECTCSLSQIQGYQKKISGPLLDRIDLVIPVGRISHEELLQTSASTRENDILRDRILKARQTQAERYQDYTITNASLNSKQIKHHFDLSNEVKNLLDTAAKQVELSTRSYFKILKVARSIADLESKSAILPEHISEALQYRSS